MSNDSSRSSVDPRLEGSGRRRLPWILYGAMLVLLAVTVTITIRNGTFEGFVAIAVMMMLGYGTVGALIASRVPDNPLGWAMLTIGLGFVLVGLSDETLTYALVTKPGAWVPLLGVAAFLSGWTFFLVLGAMVLVLVLFPTGRVHSRRWRLLPLAIVATTAVSAMLAILTPGPIESDSDVPLGIDNPTGIDALEPVIEAAWVVAGPASLIVVIASVIALVMRFRKAGGDERQQIRWLAYLAMLACVLFAGAILSSIGIGPNETRIVSEAFFLATFACIGIAFPVAIAVAIFRYRLYDLDLVVKKTVVFSVVAIVLTALYLGFVGIATLGGVSRLIFGILVLAVTFNPVRRAARSIADRLVYGRRATPYEVLSEFSERMTETYSTDDVLPRMAQVLQGATGATRADVWLRVGRQLRASASSPSDQSSHPPVAAADDSLPALPGSFAAEVRHQGALLGALTVIMPANDPLDPSRERLVRDLAAQAGPVLRNVRLIEELRASRQRLVAAQDAERRKLERNIHDGAQQQLVALGVRLRLADTLVDRDAAKAHEMLAQLQTETQGAIDDLRDLARGIYPPLLADQGLGSALEAQARKSVMPVEVSADGVGRFGQDVEAAVYFTCLEALQNIAKYADASRATISLAHRNGSLEFSVADDGTGFDVTTVEGGSGLQGMADRIDAIGGTFKVESHPGSGTTVRGTVPVV